MIQVAHQFLTMSPLNQLRIFKISQGFPWRPSYMSWLQLWAWPCHCERPNLGSSCPAARPSSDTWRWRMHRAHLKYVPIHSLGLGSPKSHPTSQSSDGSEKFPASSASVVVPYCFGLSPYLDNVRNRMILETGLSQGNIDDGSVMDRGQRKTTWFVSWWILTVRYRSKLVCFQIKCKGCINCAFKGIKPKGTLQKDGMPLPAPAPGFPIVTKAH